MHAVALQFVQSRLGLLDLRPLAVLLLETLQCSHGVSLLGSLPVRRPFERRDLVVGFLGMRSVRLLLQILLVAVGGVRLLRLGPGLIVLQFLDAIARFLCVSVVGMLREEEIGRASCRERV